MDLTFFLIGIPVASTMIFLMLLLAARQNKGIRQEIEREVAATRQAGIAARARIVDLRCAEVQRYRRNNLTTFKFLLEIFPGDLQPAFTASAVWELEPAAANRLQRGAVVPIIFDRANLRRIFPETDGAHYFQENQHAYLGIENDFQPEQIAAAHRQQQTQTQSALASYAPAPNTIYRRRSQMTVFGLPLWEIAFNLVNKKGRTRHIRQAKARAVFAVGDSATGVVAIGGFAKGLIAAGQFSCGLISFGIFSVGLLACGMFGLGALSLGIFGGGALSVAAAFNVGYAAIGLLPFYAKYEFGKDYQSPEMLRLYDILKTFTGLNDSQLADAAGAAFFAFLTASVALFLFSFVAKFLIVQTLQPNDNRIESPTAN